MRLSLTKTERQAVYSGSIAEIVRPVDSANSTVLGRKARTDHDAREWFDGWQNLGINDERTYSDGHQNKIVPNGLFGVGRNPNASCGEYLHCPVLGEGADGRFYRVRSHIQPGDVLRFGSVVKTYCKAVQVRNIDGIWNWVYRFNPVRR